jgi:hypothetical protein
VTKSARGFDWFKAFWMVSIGAGVTLLVISFVVPYISFSGTVIKDGPPASEVFNATYPYFTDTFSIPPVRAGTSVHLTATRSGPGNVTIQLVGFYAGTGTPEAYTIRLDDVVPSVDTDLMLHNSGTYVFLVTSYSARYSLTVSGTWQSLYDVSLGIYWGSALLMAGLVSFYYYRIVRRREELIEKERREGGEKTDSKVPYV